MLDKIYARDFGVCGIKARQLDRATSGPRKVAAIRSERSPFPTRWGDVALYHIAVWTSEQRASKILVCRTPSRELRRTWVRVYWTKVSLILWYLSVRQPVTRFQ